MTKKLSAAFPPSHVTVRERSAPVPIGGLAKSEWGPYSTVAATFFIGMKKGEKPESRSGLCTRQPAVFRQATLDKRVRALRVFGLINQGVPKSEAGKLFAASRVEQKGWYKGEEEPSSAYMIIHNSDIPGEATVEEFREKMKRLAEMASGSLCQDEVILSFESPTGKTGEGLAPDPEDRKIAEELFGKDVQPERAPRKTKRWKAKR